MRSGGAFIGVSLDSKAFSRAWVRHALAWILERHDSLLVVVADELSYYTRSTNGSSRQARLVLADSIARAEARYRELRRFFESEINRLPEEDRRRVQLCKWEDFSDRRYSTLLRLLRIAYHSIPDFASSVEGVAAAHAGKLGDAQDRDRTTRLCVGFLLDEMAMAIRITEVEGFRYEYYPGKDLDALGDMYAGRWSRSGLSVKDLVGSESRRLFANLVLDRCAFHGGVGGQPTPPALKTA